MGASRLGERARWPGADAATGDLADGAADDDQQRAQQAEKPAELQADEGAVLPDPVDDSVVEDERRRNGADDHRHLARGPRELMAAHNDPDQDQRGESGENEQDVQDRERLEAVAVDLPGTAEVLVSLHAEPVDQQAEE